MKENLWIFGALLLAVSFFFDYEILRFISLIKVGFLFEIMKVISYEWILGLVVLIYFIMLKDKKKILLLGISVVIACILTFLLKLVVMRERPENMLEFDYSFPSGHATVIFSTVALMNREFPKLKYWFIGVALIIAFSRLYLGVHYASDLVAGGFLGYAIGYGILHRKVILTKIRGLMQKK